MPVIALLIVVSLGLALTFLGAFIWAVRSGQFEDTFTPSLRVLTEEETGKPNPPSEPIQQPTQNRTKP
jgi:cbb3-type cytochrome oxidase maturation protein